MWCHIWRHDKRQNRNYYDVTTMTSQPWRHQYDVTTMTSRIWRHSIYLSRRSVPTSAPTRPHQHLHRVLQRKVKINLRWILQRSESRSIWGAWRLLTCTAGSFYGIVELRRSGHYNSLQHFVFFSGLGWLNDFTNCLCEKVPRNHSGFTKYGRWIETRTMVRNHDEFLVVVHVKRLSHWRNVRNASE